jgi:O-antigen/teichoic acid export membrane protein
VYIWENPHPACGLERGKGMSLKTPLHLQLNRRRVLGNVAALFSGSTVAQGATAVALLLTARQLGVEAYGQYAACFVLASVTAVVYNLGLDIWLLREGGRDASRLGEMVGSVMAIKGAGGLVWLGLITLIAPLVRADLFPPALIAFSGLAVLVDNLFAATLAAYKASMRNTFTFVIESAADLVWLGATLLLILAAYTEALVYVQVRAAALALGLLVSAGMVWRLFGLKITRETVQLALRKAFPYAGSEFLAAAAMRVDVLIIALILGKGAAGLYSPAVGIINALFLIPAALYIVMVPVLTSLFAENVRQGWLTTARATGVAAVVGLGLAAAMLLGAGPLVSLLGESFRGSKELLQLMSVILFLHSLTFMMAAVLVAAEQQSRRMVMQALAVGSNVVLNLALLPVLGVVGAAWAYIASEIVLLGGYAWLIYRFRLRLTTSSRSPHKIV